MTAGTAGEAQGAVQVEIAAGVMTVTLADVKNRNALSPELLQGLDDAIRSANERPEIRAVVITNQGNTFCAGANLKRARSEKPTIGFEQLLQTIQSSRTPVLGRIAGHVVGGGNGLAAALDISIAADHVEFGFTEVRLGVAPAIISVVCLPKMRPGEAMEAFLRGNRFSAAKAAALGLINRAVPAHELDAAIEELLVDLQQGGPNALGFAKRLVYEVPRMEQKEAFEWSSRLSAELFSGDEAKEGIAAFVGKRKPRWAAHADEDD